MDYKNLITEVKNITSKLPKPLARIILILCVLLVTALMYLTSCSVIANYKSSNNHSDISTNAKVDTTLIDKAVQLINN